MLTSGNPPHQGQWGKGSKSSPCRTRPSSAAAVGAADRQEAGVALLVRGEEREGADRAGPSAFPSVPFQFCRQ